MHTWKDCRERVFVSVNYTIVLRKLYDLRLRDLRMQCTHIDNEQNENVSVELVKSAI